MSLRKKIKKMKAGVKVILGSIVIFILALIFGYASWAGTPVEMSYQYTLDKLQTKYTHFVHNGMFTLPIASNSKTDTLYWGDSTYIFRIDTLINITAAPDETLLIRTDGIMYIDTSGTDTLFVIMGGSNVAIVP